MRYLYIGCTGGDFDVDEVLTTEEEYCETCGDGATYVGSYETEEEREKLLSKHYDY